MTGFPLVRRLALAMALASAPAAALAADGACDPHIREALEIRARSGAEAEIALIRHPASGIREPLSIVDFSCGGDLFGYRPFDIFFDPGHAMADILRLGGAVVCEAAQRAWQAGFNRELPATIFERAGEGG